MDEIFNVVHGTVISNVSFDNKSTKQLKYGDIFYRDPIDQPSEKHSVFDLSSNKTEFHNSINNEIVEGGGDGPEDWNGAYEIAINQIN